MKPNKLALTVAVVCIPVWTALSDVTLTKVNASDYAPGDHFGRAVAVAGDVAVIGAMSDDEDAGSAYVFVRTGAVWGQEIKLTPGDRSPGARFGRAVAISADDIVVGAEMDPQGAPVAGAVYVFNRLGGVWTEQAKLMPDDLARGDRFGTSVALSGNYLLVGSHRDDDRGSNSGSAYVFKRELTGWVQQAKLTALDGAADDQFGFSCAMDGEYAVVGAWQKNGNTGAAYVFKREGETWSQQAKLTANDGATGDYFGSWWIGISGEYVLVGALEDDDLGTNSGSAYLFRRAGTTWAQQIKLLASDGAAGDGFGSSVAISGDYAIVGAWEGNGGTGAAYLFRREGELWTEQEILRPADLAEGDDFGYASAMSGGDALVGCDDDVIGGVSAGSAYFVTEYFDTLPDVSTTLRSDDEPIILPPEGGSFSYTMGFANNTPDIQTVDMWLELANPLGSVTTLFGPKRKSLAGNATLEKLRTQSVPAANPPGTYHLILYAGTYPSSPLDRDTLSFSKLPSPEAGSKGPAVGLADGAGIDAVFPNPFNPSTIIRYRLSAVSHVSLTIFDLVGREIVTLVNDNAEPGTYSHQWDAGGMPGGVYFAVLRSGAAVSVQKLMLVK